MRVTLTEKPVDKIDIPLFLLLQFEDEFPLRGPSSVVDWRLNGRLSRFIIEGGFRGSARETLLFPAEARMKPAQTILVGLGPRQIFEEVHIGQVLEFIFDLVEKKKEKEVGLSLAQMIPDPFEWRNALRLLHSRGHHHSSIQRVTLCEPHECLVEARKRQMDFGGSMELVFE